MKLYVAFLAIISLLGAQTAFHEDTFRGRQAYVLENGKMRVSALRGGGHLAEIRLQSDDPRKNVNPMRVPHYPTIEPHQYDPARHDALYGSDSHRWLSSGYMGHLLCFPEFGPPSPEEVRSGLGNHGEAPIVEWKKQKTEIRDDGVSLWYGAELPRTQFRVERRLLLPAGENILYVDEWVENLTPFDRPINWVQHATFGPPFVAHGKNFLDTSATRGKTGAGAGANNPLAPDTEFEWPSAPGAGGRKLSLRDFNSAPGSGTYYAMLLDPKRTLSYFTVYNSDYGVLIGYLFPTSDNPWIADWQENHRNQFKPWDGKVIARGLEFGTSPMPEGLRKSVERGSLFGVPTYRWIGGRERLQTRFAVLLSEIPAGFRGVADLQVEKGRIVIRERENGRTIEVKSSRDW